MLIVTVIENRKEEPISFFGVRVTTVHGPELLPALIASTHGVQVSSITDEADRFLSIFVEFLCSFQGVHRKTLVNC